MDSSNILQGMHDTHRTEPDHRLLFEIAASQRGYFTAGQARECGFGWDLLAYHAKTGRFRRVQRGLYRFRDYPSSMHEEVVAAWLAVGKDIAVVSHESALELLELSDVIPTAVHLTVPRDKRYLRPPPDTVVHTTVVPVPRRDTVVREGIRMTSPSRTIVDAAEAGTDPDQVVKAVRQALRHGVTTEHHLRSELQDRDADVGQLIEMAIETMESPT